MLSVFDTHVGYDFAQGRALIPSLPVECTVRRFVRCSE